ncbi:hypothetical protein LB504_013139 [Fusarium proliferatum]|nr:hypothetical protein LB504_013139 [Fusarium proliferatum]
MPRPNTIKQRRAQPGERSSATKPMFNASFTPRTVTQHDIPEWRQDNKYILAGYRPLDANYLQVVKSLTFLHNETCNVYTHLIGAILLPFFATTRFQHIYWSQYIDAPRTDFIMFSVFFCSAESCLIFSAVYHLIGSYSREVEQFWHRVDLLGIVIVTTGTLIPSIYYIFICEPMLQKIHWTIVCYWHHINTPSALRVTSLPSMLTRSLGHNLWIYHSGSHLYSRVQDLAVAQDEGRCLHNARCIRFYPFATWRAGLWDRIHAGVFERETVPCRAPSVRNGLWLLCRVKFRIPERFAPGHFDTWLSSHQIFHVLILCAMYMHTIALTQAFTACRTLDICHIQFVHQARCSKS